MKRKERDPCHGNFPYVTVTCWITECDLLYGEIHQNST
ncbi:hypothetical protein T11_10302 [Trichinella zimbabwensis]|uniref:Uncharacterized protein n=1 Tax=Trichinella zimbabwensis TaxID=268475 RepID=A0A0V1GT92_9BILA|nr:hypothetical protein T11_10302 [Trichinella zimbabwensis]